MSDGIGCECSARSEGECCCGADWTTQELVELRKQRDELLDAIKESANVKQSLIDWRQKKFPDTDQQAVIDKEFPKLTSAIASVKGGAA